jgi:hypothetical protein
VLLAIVGAAVDPHLWDKQIAGHNGLQDTQRRCNKMLRSHVWMRPQTLRARQFIHTCGKQAAVRLLQLLWSTVEVVGPGSGSWNIHQASIR